MRRLCENARFPGLMRATRRRACGCIRAGASLSPGKWMGAQARHRLASWMIVCPHMLSAQTRLLLVISPLYKNTSQSGLRCRRLSCFTSEVKRRIVRTLLVNPLSRV